VQFFHAGTAIVDDQLLTSGGRVVSVAAYGDVLDEAVDRAYKGVAAVRGKDLYFRHDIAKQAYGI
jgi:phosphoribosylamine-glycine ligase